MNKGSKCTAHYTVQTMDINYGASNGCPPGGFRADLRTGTINHRKVK